MTRASLAERAGRSTVTGAVVLFAVWTLVYQVALFTGLPSTVALVAALALGAGAVVVVSRLRHDSSSTPVTFPGGAASLTVLGVAVVATAFASAHLRILAMTLGVVAALTALVLSSRFAPRLELLRRGREQHGAGSGGIDTDPAAAGAAESGEGRNDGSSVSSGRTLWLLGWLGGGVSGVLASIIATPDGDDAYFVNLSTWVAERGRFPLRDTMISSEVFPGIQGHSPPTHSIEALFGSVARVLGLEAGTVTYVLAPPVLTLLAVLVLTLLVSEARIPAAPFALVATTVFLWTAGRTGYGLGGFFAVRIWQGKAMLVAAVLPLVFLYGSRLIRRGGARSQALFAAALVSSVGFSNTSSFLLPVLIGGLVLGALSLGEWRGSLRLLAWVAYPVAVGALSLVLAPPAATDAELIANGFTTGPLTFSIDPLATVPGITGMLVVTALAIGVGTLGLGNSAMRMGAAGTIVTGGLALLPPVRELFRDVGLWSVVWRMWWAIPITLLLAGTVGAVARWMEGRRLAVPAITATAALIALVPLVGGRWVGDPRNDARWASPWTWKLPPRALAQAKLVESLSHPGDVVLVPANTARALSTLTVDFHPVSARPFCLPNYAATPEAQSGERRVLQQFVDVTTPDDPTAIEHALDVLDVRTACLANHRDGGIRLLEADGFHVVDQGHGITCLQR